MIITCGTSCAVRLRSRRGRRTLAVRMIIIIVIIMIVIVIVIVLIIGVVVVVVEVVVVVVDLGTLISAVSQASGQALSPELVYLKLCIYIYIYI